MQKVLWILLLLVGFTGMSRAAVTVAADSTATETKEQTLYIFGVSQNLRDSVSQFRSYVEQTFSSSHQTAVVFFDVKAAKLEKMRQKLRVKIAGQKVGLEKMVVKDVYKDQFQFKKIEVAGSN